MKKARKILKFALKKLSASSKRSFVSAVILAGGKSERFNSSKQLASICGMPAILRSAAAFEKCPDIDEIIVVCRSEEEQPITEILQNGNIKKFKCTAPAGESRFLSVKNGFEKTSASADLVAVHDGARCLVESYMISKVIAAAKKSGAAIAAAHTIDTIKLSDENGVIKSTVKRDDAWNAQTPQIFLRAILETGIYAPREDGFSPTDDASLVETLGFSVTLVDCGYENIKLTTPTDMFAAEKIIEKRSANETKI